MGMSAEPARPGGCVMTTGERPAGFWREVTPVEFEVAASLYSRFPYLGDGDKVRGRKSPDDEWREGVVDFLWLGIEEMIQVVHDDGNVNYSVGTHSIDRLQQWCTDSDFTDEQLFQVSEAIYAEFVASWGTDDWDAESAAEKLADSVVKTLKEG